MTSAPSSFRAWGTSERPRWSIACHWCAQCRATWHPWVSDAPRSRSWRCERPARRCSSIGTGGRRSRIAAATACFQWAYRTVGTHRPVSGPATHKCQWFRSPTSNGSLLEGCRSTWWWSLSLARTRSFHSMFMFIIRFFHSQFRDFFSTLSATLELTSTHVSAAFSQRTPTVNFWLKFRFVLQYINFFFQNISSLFLFRYLCPIM